MSVPEFLLKEKKEIKLEIKEYLSYIDNKKIRNVSAYMINAGGKRIRPLLLILAHKAVGGRYVDRVIPLGTAIELIHTWTLIHDDIIDKSEMRRNVPTIHMKWDTNTALLAGDALSNLAYVLLVKADFDKGTINRIVEICAKASLELIDGEIMDLDFEKRIYITESEYFEMAKKKTGSLIKSAVKIGAMVGTKDEGKIRAFEKYGELIGVAFQIKDDLLDLMADKGKLGKDMGKDIKEGKRTLMVIHAFNNAVPKNVNRLINIFSSRDLSEEEIREAIDILKREGSIEYAQHVLLKLIKKAKNILGVLPKTEYKSALLELSDFIISREE